MSLWSGISLKWQGVKDQPQPGKGFWEKGCLGAAKELKSQVQADGLCSAWDGSPDCIALVFCSLKTAFSCSSNNSLDSLALADQKPSLLFTYQLNLYPFWFPGKFPGKFSFDYPMKQHPMTPAPWFLGRDSKHKHKHLYSWVVGLHCGFTILTTSGPKMPLPEADFEFRNQIPLPTFVFVFVSFWQAGW